MLAAAAEAAAAAAASALPAIAAVVVSALISRICPNGNKDASGWTKKLWRGHETRPFYSSGLRHRELARVWHCAVLTK